MPKRIKKRSRASPSRTPSPRKKPSPLKKLVLRRTSQTPERTVYQVVARIPSTTALTTPKTAAPFLEESFDETSPPLIHQKSKNYSNDRKKYNKYGLEESEEDERTSSPPKLIRLDKEDKSQRHTVTQASKKFANNRRKLNSYGLEESADDESEADEEENIKAVKKLKKKKKTPKKSKNDSKAVESVKDKISPSINNQILEFGLDGAEMIGDIASLLDQSLTSLRISKSKYGIEEERVESPLTSAKDESTEEEEIVEKDISMEQIVQIEFQDTVPNIVMEESYERIPKSERKSASFVQDISHNSTMSPKLLQKCSFEDSADIEIENIEPKPTVSIAKQELPSTSHQKIRDETAPRISSPFSSKPLAPNQEPPSKKISSPFTFTPEQLERFKSQQKLQQPHAPIPKGPVAVKLVPQNRSCAPVFIQISQKDFHRMLPKLPLQPTNSDNC